jgi:hypothetical protein
MLDTLTQWITSAITWVISCLPNTPFKNLDMSPIQSILPYINWVIPVDFIMTVTQAWLAAITVYYIYSAVMRWVKVL